MSDPTSTRFINVDFEIRCDEGLADLLRALGPLACPLHSSETEATLELLEQPGSAEEAVLSFGRGIESLPSEARELWNRCSKREVDVGVEGGHEPFLFRMQLSADALALLARVGATLTFTVYAAHHPAVAWGGEQGGRR